MTTDGHRSRVILNVMEGGEFVELSRLARRLHEDGAEIFFWFAAAGYLNYERDSEICRARGYRWLDARGRLFGDPGLAVDETGYRPPSLTLDTPSRPLLPALLGMAVLGLLLLPLYLLRVLLALPLRLLRRRRRSASFPAEVLLTLRTTVALYRRLRRARGVVDRLQPTLIVVGQDYAGSASALLIEAGHRRGVSTMLVPFALGTAREVAESLHGSSAYQVSASPLNRLLVWARPHWLHRYKGHRLVRLPGSQALPVELLGLAPPHPWIPNSGAADVLAVESQEMLDYYADMSFAPDQLALTGSMNDDVLHAALVRRDELRSTIEEELELEPGRPLLLCAWPPDQFGGRKLDDCDFSSYKRLCQFWAESLAEARDRFGYNVVVRLHPVLRRSDMDALQDLGIPMSRRPTADLIPLADVFVASVSSTIRWAISAGMPVVNFDVYRYGYTDFREDHGVLTSETSEDYLRDLRRVVGDADFREALLDRQRPVRGRWGALDGRSGDRMAALARELTVRERR